MKCPNAPQHDNYTNVQTKLTSFLISKTSNMTGHHREACSSWCYMRSRFLQIFLIFSSPEGHRYSFPFHVHNLCIRYGTALANTAVPCMHVRIVYLPVCGAPGEFIITLLCCKYFSSSSVVCKNLSLIHISEPTRPY